MEIVKNLEGEVVIPYKWSLGEYVGKFYEGLKQKKILGSKCSKCGKVMVPPCVVCGVCFEEAKEFVEIKDEGEVATFTVINFRYPGQFLTPPYAVAIIKLFGSDTRFHHLIKGDLEKLKIGSTVKAKWKDERVGSFFDIEYFEILK
jgi:hypothetical protein